MKSAPLPLVSRPRVGTTAGWPSKSEKEVSRLTSWLSFFVNDTATTEIYTLSLHDALPISGRVHGAAELDEHAITGNLENPARDRKSTRLNSSHVRISYAVFCLKKTKNTIANSAKLVRTTNPIHLIIHAPPR